MNTKFALGISITIVSTSLLNACASLMTQPSAGYVAAVNAVQVRLCFRSGIAPPPGQEVYVKSRFRRTYRSLHDIGTARIIAADAEGCASATILDGHPQLKDDVLLSRTY